MLLERNLPIQYLDNSITLSKASYPSATMKFLLSLSLATLSVAIAVPATPGSAVGFTQADLAALAVTVHSTERASLDVDAK